MEKHKEESHGFTYDVFISFRGEDVRHGFLGYLREVLSQKGINTFVDDSNLPVGKSISPALSKAIEESNIFIVVFSENYASSTWCLDELVKILECSRDKKQLVFPIFYHVDPSHIRHQRETFSVHMKAHEKRFGEGSPKVQAWKSALTEACNFPGQHIATGSDKYEIDLIKEIVEKVHKNVAPKPLGVGEKPVGLGPRIEEVKSLLDMKLDDVRMLGIYGLGGIGKTELARALYDKIVRDFDAASFLGDVREKSNKINGLEDLQKTLLSEMKEELETELGSTSKGMYEIKRRLRQKKVLLVLDDVDDKDQLEKLAGGRDWFGKGSRIIITTRDNDALIAHQVEEMYLMKELNKQHSLELFCWNAFKQCQPKASFEKVSLRAVGFAKRLPLALKIIASDLAAEETLDDWENALEDYEKTHPNEKIHNVLKTSYDRLGNIPKQVFLDIACFFKGEKKEYVENILEEFGATTNIKVLCKKSLLTIDDGCLKMHDLIQDMGREIVRREEEQNPGGRSRVWHYEDVIDILTDDLGSDKIQGIMLDPPQRQEVDWSGTAFEKMKRLRILIVRNTSFSPEPQYLPNQLKVLDWEEYPSKSFPLKFHPKKIIVFSLPKSHLTLQEPFKEFSSLIKMDFSNSQSITEIPDVSKVQNLREMRLDNCRELVAIHESVGTLKRLAHLSALGCSKLRNFFQKMFLPSLEVLDLNLCASLEHFPTIEKEMKTPLKIYMINTSIHELPESISKLIGLVSIEISNCRKLEYLPSSLFMLPNVVSFKIEECPQLRESFRCFMHGPSGAHVRPTLEKLCFTNANLSDEDLIAILYCFPNLDELIASENYFVSVPAHIKECVNLTSLDMNNCWDLKNIPECTKLRVLDVHGCDSLEEISKLPSTIQKVDARCCSSLTTETSDMLWCQVKEEIRGIEVVMPLNTEIPEDLFDFVSNGGNPHFWVRGGKFPNIALALVFQFQDSSARNILARRQLVDLRLLINRQVVPRKGHYNFIIEEKHVLICDLGCLFSDEEWHGLDAFLNGEWNVVQVLCEATSTLSVTCWGAYVYRSERTNMEDVVQFTCPNPDYEFLDTPLTQEVVTKDPKEELRMMIRNLGIDLSFEKTLAEYLTNQGGEDITGHKDCMNILFPGLKKISDQAKEALESEHSALDDPKSELSQLLEKIKIIDDDGECRENKLHFMGDLVLIQLKGPLRMEGNSGYNPERQRRWKICREGMTEGLVEAQKSFPSLNIVKTKSDALNKRIRDRYCWLFDIPEKECPRLQLSIETGIRIGGIVNALLEAKLSFPDLDVWATLDAILSRNGMKGLHRSLRPFLQVILDPEQQEIMREIFCEGMTDGLVEARHKFPSLDVDGTKRAALNKGNIDRVAWKVPAELQGEGFEMMIYSEGVVNGLHEAKLSFPYLDVSGTLHGLLSKRDMNVVFVPLVPPSVLGNSFVGEASNSGHQEDPQLEQMRKIIYDWTSGCKCETKYEKMGDVLREKAEELGRQYDAEIEGHQNSEESLDLMGATYLSGLRDGILEAHAMYTKTEELVIDCIGGCNCETKYEKMSSILKGRVEELGRQYDAEIEGIQNSEEFQDLTTATYLNGLRDGLLQAQEILLSSAENNCLGK